MNDGQPKSLTTTAKQRGVALITTLMVMSTLSILALATLRTNLLESTMARNHQESTRALLNAEAGIAHAIDHIDDFDITDDHANNSTQITLNGGSFTYTRRYLGSTPLPEPANSSDHASGQLRHYEIRSRGVTATKLHAVVNQSIHVATRDSPSELTKNTARFTSSRVLRSSWYQE